MGFFKKLFSGKTGNKPDGSDNAAENAQTAPATSAADEIIKADLMIDQLAAYYTATGDELYRKAYLQKTTALGVSGKEAESLFDFECGVCKKYSKEALLNKKYVTSWLIDLKQPFLKDAPDTKEALSEELFFTIGELCKFIDEAEWHFWNSHEREMPDEVWKEICEWRMNGGGGVFAIGSYLPAVSEKYPISMEAFSKLFNFYGAFLSKNKWG